MVPSMFDVFRMDITMFMVLVICVYALVKTTSSMFKGIPDSWGDWSALKPFRSWFVDGLPSELKRWVSLIYAFLISWVFKFHMISNMFGAYNRERGATDVVIPRFLDYIIVAGLLFAFSKLLYNIIEGFVERHGKSQEE